MYTSEREDTEPVPAHHTEPCHSQRLGWVSLSEDERAAGGVLCPCVVGILQLGDTWKINNGLSYSSFTTFSSIPRPVIIQQLKLGYEMCRPHILKGNNANYIQIKLYVLSSSVKFNLGSHSVTWRGICKQVWKTRAENFPFAMTCNSNAKRKSIITFNLIVLLTSTLGLQLSLLLEPCPGHHCLHYPTLHYTVGKLFWKRTLWSKALGLEGHVFFGLRIKCWINN